jgi:hypothetical protein
MLRSGGNRIFDRSGVPLLTRTCFQHEKIKSGDAHFCLDPRE